MRQRGYRAACTRLRKCWIIRSSREGQPVPEPAIASRMRSLIGSSASELRELRETVRKMLKENGSPPQGKWAEIALLEPVRDYKARHASTMLTFDAVVDAIGQIEARQPASAQG